MIGFSWQQGAQLPAALFQRRMRFSSTREYDDVVDMARDAFGVGNSSVSRGFVLTPAHTPSTTRTQSLEPSLWAEGYETERLEFLGSEAEMTVYVPFVGSYQRSLTFRPLVIAVVSTVIPRRVGI